MNVVRVEFRGAWIVAVLLFLVSGYTLLAAGADRTPALTALAVGFLAGAISSAFASDAIRFGAAVIAGFVIFMLATQVIYSSRMALALICLGASARWVASILVDLIRKSLQSGPESPG